MQITQNINIYILLMILFSAIAGIGQIGMPRVIEHSCSSGWVSGFIWS